MFLPHTCDWNMILWYIPVPERTPTNNFFGGRQALAAQHWMNSDVAYQDRIDTKKAITHTWRERKIQRAYGSDEKNGHIQGVLMTPLDTKAEHVYAIRATPAPRPNKHLMV